MKTFLEGGAIKSYSDFLVVLAPEKQKVKPGNETSYHPFSDGSWKGME